MKPRTTGTLAASAGVGEVDPVTGTAAIAMATVAVDLPAARRRLASSELTAVGHAVRCRTDGEADCYTSYIVDAVGQANRKIAWKRKSAWSLTAT